MVAGKGHNWSPPCLVDRLDGFIGDLLGPYADNQFLVAPEGLTTPKAWKDRTWE